MRLPVDVVGPGHFVELPWVDHFAGRSRLEDRIVIFRDVIPVDGVGSIQYGNFVGRKLWVACFEAFHQLLQVVILCASARFGFDCEVDLDDLVTEEAVIHLQHRPESSDAYGTPLKNGADGERIINIPPGVVDLLQAYIGHNRHDMTDKFDRDPLFMTTSGHISTTTIRRDFYKLSRPCEYASECPHAREIADCDAAQNAEAANCPSSFSTHPLRKWAIMSQLDTGLLKELLSDRVDVSVPVLDKHYDQRTEERKSRRRREAFEANMSQYAMTDGGQPVDEDDG